MLKHPHYKSVSQETNWALSWVNMTAKRAYLNQILLYSEFYCEEKARALKWSGKLIIVISFTFHQSKSVSEVLCRLDKKGLGDASISALNQGSPSLKHRTQEQSLSFQCPKEYADKFHEGFKSTEVIETHRSRESRTFHLFLVKLILIEESRTSLWIQQVESQAHLRTHKKNKRLVCVYKCRLANDTERKTSQSSKITFEWIWLL